VSSAYATSEHPVVRGRALATLALTALGVVYGDIGTSPLYALKECFGARHGVPPTPENVLGVLSLIIWSLTFVISFKYLICVMKADNRGEGGILALLALVRPSSEPRGMRLLLVGVGLIGAALLYGDGVITPAISVLGAVEGLQVASDFFHGGVVTIIATVILVLLFLIQQWGTHGVGRLFGPVMVVWFLCIAALGVRGIMLDPSVLRAVNPWHAVDFFIRDGVQGFLILGAVVLVLTGGEALYADMGHFGRRPIRLAWFWVVFPALVLNYFGQGALLLHRVDAASNPFYKLVPEQLLYPMIVIATLAAVVASQALISGAFSLTRQAVQLGYAPRVTIRHTSEREVGQIFIPEVNWALMVACIWLVVNFKRTDNLAAAYGIAVTGTMMITTVLYAYVARVRWQWAWWRVIGLAGAFFVVDLAFFSANLIKVEDGGWFPLVVALGVYTLMSTWKRGRRILSEIMEEDSLPIDLFLHDVARRIPVRVPGTAVFLTSHTRGAPPVLLHHVKHNKVLHQTVILMSVKTEEIPTVRERDRAEVADLGQGFYTVTAHYGFMETPDVPAVLRSLSAKGLEAKPMDTTYYLGRETLITSRTQRRARPVASDRRMPLWRRRLFTLMARNAQTATAFFGLPPNRVVEMGAQIQF
jgi:KUP system potassium uptake protein